MTMEETESTKIDNEKDKRKNDKICSGCGLIFKSKNALFRHLGNSAKTCLSPEEQEEFRTLFLYNEKNLEKVVVLYGYSVGSVPLDDSGNGDDNKVYSGGDSAAELVMKAIHAVSYEKKDKNFIEQIIQSNCNKISRSYGCLSRGGNLMLQESQTGALMEVMTARLPPFFYDTPQERKEQTQAWVEKVNKYLGGISNQLNNDATVRVFGRLSIPKRFSAEMDVTHLRMDYLIPVDFLFHHESDKNKILETNALEKFFDMFQSFQPTRSHTFHRRKNIPLNHTSSGPDSLKYFHTLKKLMQGMTCQVVELDITNANDVMQKEFHEKKRAFQRKKPKRGPNDSVHMTKLEKKETNQQKVDELNNDAQLKENNIIEDDDNNINTDNRCKSSTKNPRHKKDKKDKNVKERKNVLRRRRYHNFSPRAMAHEFLTYRRVDRFYHRGTYRFEDKKLCPSPAEYDMVKQQNRPFALLSISGDNFLNGQVRSMIGLFLAITRGAISEDIIECMFDEEYPNLVPAPMAPVTGLYAADVQYMFWEGKAKTILSPRQCNRYEYGWNDEKVISDVNDFEQLIQTSIAKAWFNDGFVDESCNGDYVLKRLKVEQTWVKDCLEPWVACANLQLEDYKKWKEAKAQVATSTKISTIAESLLPPIESADSSVPALFEKVLSLLRNADTSGLWPTTTPKRQLVMISTHENKDKNDMSLSIAHMKAYNNCVERTSGKSFDAIIIICCVKKLQF